MIRATFVRCFIVLSAVSLLSRPAAAEDAKFTPLFNGKSLDGWNKIGDGTWKVLDGVIHGSSDPSQKRHGYLTTKKQYSDFVVRLKFKTAAGDSGLYFRVERDGDELIGMQANIDPRGDTGGLYLGFCNLGFQDQLLRVLLLSLLANTRCCVASIV